MTVKEVPLQAANVGRIKLESLLSDGDTSRAPDGTYNEDRYDFDEFFYATQDRGWKVPVDDRLRLMYRRFFDAEVVASQRARDKVLRDLEKRICSKLTNTGTYTSVAATAALSSKSSASIVADVHARLKAVRAACGIIPNTVAMDWDAFVSASETDEVIDRIKFAGIDDPKNVTMNAMASLFKVDQVVVFGGQRNSANPKQARNLTSLWDKTIIGVGVVARGEDIIAPCVGRTFHWSEDGSDIGATIEQYYDDDARGWKYRARMDVDERVYYPETWQLITGN
jgi:hypothetical protein